MDCIFIEELFFEVLQVALDRRERLSKVLTDDEWKALFKICQKQTLTAFVYTALGKLENMGQKPPKDLLYQWISISELIKRQNRMMNDELLEWTSFFGNAGLHSVVLKGQANAVLYPDPLSRQPGDIDIYVEGGRQKLYNLLIEKVGINENCRNNIAPSHHHIHLPRNKNGIEVEIHYQLSSGNHNPITNRRLQKLLKEEYLKGTELKQEGFGVPSLKFALIMQLSHIQSHAISSGIGLRQIVDYYYLLKAGGKSLSTSSINLSKLGLRNIAGAIMWIMKEKMQIEDKYLVVPADYMRGKILLNIIMDGGNFGHYSRKPAKGSLLSMALKKHVMKLPLMRLNASEVLWQEIDSVVFFIKTLPRRIGKRSLI